MDHARHQQGRIQGTWGAGLKAEGGCCRLRAAAGRLRKAQVKSDRNAGDVTAERRLNDALEGSMLSRVVLKS